MKLTGGQIAQLLRAKEDERVEFKRAASELPDNLWETYSAFCNTDGGTIISNPGTMRISKSVAVAGGTSDARNTAIFNIFALVDIGERSGMGLANLHGLWKKYGYAEPKITESYDPDRTVIVVTTDDDTENDTVARPENGAEPDQKTTRTRPEVDNKVDNNLGDDTVKHPQPRTRTTPVQHPYNEPKFRTTTIPVQDPNEDLILRELPADAWARQGRTLGGRRIVKTICR